MACCEKTYRLPNEVQRKVFAKRPPFFVISVPVHIRIIGPIAGFQVDEDIDMTLAKRSPRRYSVQPGLEPFKKVD